MGNTTNVPSGPVTAQIHDKFKVFIPAAGMEYHEAMKQIGDQVAAWSKESKVAPKSVGVEYIEKSKQLVLSVGYVDADEKDRYPVTLQVVSIGNPKLVAADIENVMNQAAVGVPHVICHEFFVTEDGEFVMVFMAHG